MTADCADIVKSIGMTDAYLSIRNKVPPNTQTYLPRDQPDGSTF